jgi:hypothetical protein
MDLPLSINRLHCYPDNLASAISVFQFLPFQGNYIGPDVTGTKYIGSGAGIQVAANNNLIGGTSPGAGNLITGGNVFGTNFLGDGNLVQGNLYGTDPTGRTAQGNDNVLTPAETSV